MLSGSRNSKLVSLYNIQIMFDYNEEGRIQNVFFCKQKTADELRISDWSSDVCSSDLLDGLRKARFVDVADRDMTAAPGEFNRQFAAHAGTRARDRRDLVLEILH